MQHSQAEPYVLGLDIGANSVGWACLRLDDKDRPVGLLFAPAEMPESPCVGVRIFERGVENYEQGQKEETRGVARRKARQQRRQTQRRARRLKRTFRTLQAAGLLPQLESNAIQTAGSPELARDALIKRLDHEIALELTVEDTDIRHQLLPYVLRTAALDRSLTRHQLGRALYHLSQRRGFKSGRKEGRSDDDEGQVKASISDLKAAIAKAGHRTLGEHLLKCAKDGERIRKRWTAREMYVAEFEAIVAAQSRHHGDVLTTAFVKSLRRTIFHQRPLRSQRGSIGPCEIEDGSEYAHPKTGEIARSRKRCRAPECFLDSQRFRLLQSVNNLAIAVPGNPSQQLTAEQRARLVGELEKSESLTFSEVSKLLGLPRTTKYNLQEGGEKRIKGNRTNAALLSIFGDRWTKLDAHQQHNVVLELWGTPDEEVLRRRASSRLGAWALLNPSKAEAEAAAKVPLSSDYMSLSRMAMQRLIPHLERGLVYSAAVDAEYGRRVSTAALGQLPPVLESLPDLRNPVVARALTELRRVVNQLVANYGKPKLVRVELARDLKRSKLDRQKLARQMRENEEEREDAREEIRKCVDAGISDPRPSDILKLRLWKECGGTCPYSGRSIGMTQLLRGEVDIEHILPLSRSLDDSFLNKTLCFADVNRNEKKNRTPYDAFGAQATRWQEMVRRMEIAVEKHGMSPEKLRRFRLQGAELAEHLSNFTSSQLNDTRFASRLARRYMGLLFGGDIARGVDAEGKTRVQVGNGKLTSDIRNWFGMGACLTSETGDKRDDHRHHALDAVATALSVPALLKRAAEDAANYPSVRGRLPGFQAPWSTFTADISEAIRRTVVSFRVDNRVRGPLHAESLYSPQRDEQGRVSSDGQFTHKREPLESVKRRDFEKIVDPRVREIVTRHFGAQEPDAVLDINDAATWPSLPNRHGSPVPIRSVRLRRSASTVEIACGPRARHVVSDENHHIEIVEQLDRKGRPTWVGRVVSLLTAHERLRNRRPGQTDGVVDRGGGFQFSLAKNDSVRMSNQAGGSSLYTVRGFSEFNNGTVQVIFLRNEDARQVSDVPKSGRTAVPNVMRQRTCSKVTISPIGVVRPCRA
ncbi:MAG: type II CRISPR RNA-guided endonuclease Cas9 [Planctomycetes bacterium]|nr:type II CRISPR RNA-guided endonuclease Cas9 [Planctomycetota bacterium]